MHFYWFSWIDMSSQFLLIMKFPHVYTSMNVMKTVENGIAVPQQYCLCSIISISRKRHWSDKLNCTVEVHDNDDSPTWGSTLKKSGTQTWQTTFPSLSMFSDSWHPVQCSDKLRASSVALSRSEQRGSAARLSYHCRRSSDSDVRCQRMTRSHQSIWWSVHQLDQWLTAPDVSDTARRTYRRSMNSTTLQTTDYSITLFDSCRPTAPPFSVSQRYNMRHRAHSLQLPEHSTLLSDSNFLTRMLYKPHISPDVSLPI